MPKVRPLFLRSTASLLLLVSFNALANSDITGFVNALNLNKTWGGYFIQLVGAPVFESGSGCASSFAFVAVGDEYAKTFVAVATAAKLSGERLRISTSGCVSTSVGQVAKIEWIDLGIRE